MLKTALTPRWIAALVLALLVASVFVGLSKWQLDRSTQNVAQPEVTTESVKPLTSIFTPGKPMTADASDHIVTFSGHFDLAKQILVQDRLLDGKKGFWVVDAFDVDGAGQLHGAGASEQTIIPVARGWVADPGQASPPPSGTLTVTGRLLPSEAPVLSEHLPAGRVAALSTAELINVWNVSSYQGFVVSFKEVGLSGDVGAHAVASDLKGISVGPQPVEQKFNWLNIFYAVEWVVFAGFAFYLWWRLVKDDYERQLEERAEAAELRQAGQDTAEGQESVPGQESAGQESKEFEER